MRMTQEYLSQSLGWARWVNALPPQKKEEVWGSLVSTNRRPLADITIIMKGLNSLVFPDTYCLELLRPELI